MAGGTPEHAALAGAAIVLLGAQLRSGPCRLYPSDLRVRVLASDLSTYPDVTVICGPLERASDDPDAIVNPTLLIEVLSPSTEDYDRGEKREHYQRILSLREILLIASDRPRIERWRRTADGWSLDVAREGGVLELASVGAALSLNDLYDEAARGS
jgi:Uma2 family endonuclease